jgi:histidyl-tRNA synthetase
LGVRAIARLAGFPTIMAPILEDTPPFGAAGAGKGFQL